MTRLFAFRYETAHLATAPSLGQIPCAGMFVAVAILMEPTL